MVPIRTKRKVAEYRSNRGKDEPVIVHKDLIQAYMTIREVAEYCRVSTRTIDRYVKQGDLVCRRLAGRGKRLFRLADVERMLIVEKSSPVSDEELRAFIREQTGG